MVQGKRSSMPVSLAALSLCSKSHHRHRAGSQLSHERCPGRPDPACASFWRRTRVRTASQALSTFARHTVVPDSAAAATDTPDGVSEQSDDDSSSPSMHAMRRSESSSANRNQVHG